MAAMSVFVLIVDDDPAFRRLAHRLLAGFGLAVAGEAGVKHVLDFLIAEIDLALALVGATTAKDLDSSILVHA
jgi:CheY-like chemotaxis protein